MKLKRIISALIVFTMVMTCAVCVSADATYNVTTVYELGSDGAYSGNITLNASVSGATADTFVSYLLVAPVETTTGEGEEAVTTKSYEVEADGRNILHIDQATVDSSGNANFDSVKAAFAEFEGGKVKFVSSGNDTFVADGTKVDYNGDGKVTTDDKDENNKNPDVDSYVRSIDKVSKTQASVTLIDVQDNGESTNTYYVTDDNVVVFAKTGTNFGIGSNGTDRFIGTFDWINYVSGDETSLGSKAIIPIEGVKAWIVDFFNASSRTVIGVKVEMQSLETSATGTKNAVKTYTFYDPNKGVDLTVNGRYKEDVSDGKFGTIPLTGGTVMGIKKTQGTTATGETKPSEFITLEAAPVYSEVDFGYGPRKSATFLAKSAAGHFDDEIALKITAYPNGTVSHDNTIAEAGEPVELGIYENAYLGSEEFQNGYFGIQLVDSAETTEYLDPDKYDLEATPCVKDEAGEWVELDVMGTNYFISKRNVSAEEVEE